MAGNVIQFTVRGKDENTSSVFGGVVKGIAAIGAAIAGVAGARQLGDTIISFEKLRLSINTVSNSARDAEKNMALIQDFAATTPFDLNQVTSSFIKMKALGLDPSEEALRSYGNTASAMGKSLNQMVEAVADASVGEFERLKEFGIKARNEGETIKFTFQGVTTEIANNSDQIEAYLQRIGSVQFAGAMETQANSVVGAVSNMWDAFNRLGVAIGDAGIRPLIRQAALGMTAFVEKIIEHKDAIHAVIVRIVAFGIMVKQVFDTIVGGIRKLLATDLATALTSIANTLISIQKPLWDWALTVVTNIGRILIEGFPIVLASLLTIFVKSFKLIGEAIGNIIVAALMSVLTVFTEFGAAINDVITNAIMGIDDDRSFGTILAERFSGAFDQQIDTMKIAAGQMSEVGAIAAAELAEGLRQIQDTAGPVIDEALENIKVKTIETASALKDIFGINMEDAMLMAEQMVEGLSAFQDKVNETTEATVETHESVMALFREQWNTFIADMGSYTQAMAKSLVAIAKSTAKSIGDAFAATIVEGASMAKALEAIGKAVLKQIISMLVEMAAQRILTALINKGAAASDAAAETSKNAAATFGGQFAAMSSAPFPVNLTAPAVAAGMTAAMLSGTVAAGASGAAIGMALVPAAHGGLDYVPKEQTYLLDRGERVLSPNQNRDLTDFINEGDTVTGGNAITIDTIQMSVLENVASVDNFMNMTNEEIKEVVAAKIITALDSLDAEGVRPAFANRGMY